MGIFLALGMPCSAFGPCSERSESLRVFHTQRCCCVTVAVCRHCPQHPHCRPSLLTSLSWGAKQRVRSVPRHLHSDLLVQRVPMDSTEGSPPQEPLPVSRVEGSLRGPGVRPRAEGSRQSPRPGSLCRSALPAGCLCSCAYRPPGFTTLHDQGPGPRPLTSPAKETK